MKRFSEQFHKQAGSIKLKAAEKRELHDRILSYMEYHPLPAAMKQKQTKSVKQKNKAETIVSEPYFAFNINTSYMRAVFSAMAVLIVIAVPFVAERSLPGDVLYPVKVQFNEEVRSSLSLSPYAKVEWETERLERRIAEARLLASEGKLTEEVEAQVAEAVKGHSDAAQKEIANLRESDEDEAAIAEIAFASALAVQSEALEGQAEGEDVTEEGGHSVLALANVVSEEHQAAEASQAEANPAYEKLLARVEIETTRAYEIFDTVAKYASETEKLDIERRLSDIKTKVDTAIALKNGTELGEMTTATEVVIDEESVLVPEGDLVSEEEVGETDEEATEEVVDEKAELIEDAGDTEVEEVTNTEVTETDSDQKARDLLRSALSDTRKLISFMTNIDVRESVTIEDLVPVTVTEEEQREIASGLVNQVMLKTEELAQREVVDEKGDKFRLGQTVLEELTSNMDSAMSRSDYVAAEKLATEALAVLEDLFKMSTKDNVLEPVEELTGESVDDTGTTTEEASEEVIEEEANEIEEGDDGEHEEVIEEEIEDVPVAESEEV